MVTNENENDGVRSGNCMKQIAGGPRRIAESGERMLAIQTRSLSEEFEWRTEMANTRSCVWRDAATASIDSSYRCLRTKLFAER